MSERVDVDQLAPDPGGRVRVIVTFDHVPTDDDLARYDVVFVLSSINAAVLRVDHLDLERLAAEPGVVRIEPDGDVRASG
jgi:hypothetical protein